MYNSGQFITLNPKHIKYELLECLGEYRKPSTGLRVFPVPKAQITPDGRDHAIYEIWEALNLSTGTVDKIKLPIYVFKEVGDNYLEQDRVRIIDDTNEVSSLLDELSCWNTKSRSLKNFHLDIINNRHYDEIDRLRELDNDESLSDKFKVGIRYKLIQKENPNPLTKRLFKEWGELNPDLLTKLKQYVYKENTNVNN